MENGWLGWTAGIIDGEGCIYITKVRDRRNSHSLYIWIGNTSKAMVDKLSELWGTVPFKRKPRSTNICRNPRQLWIWAVTGSRAAGILKQCRPYLIAKGLQADIALDLAATFTPAGKHVSPAVEEMREHCYLKLRELKENEGRA